MSDWNFNNIEDFNSYLKGQLPWYPLFCESLLTQVFKEFATFSSTVYDLGASLGNTYLYNKETIESREINFLALETNKDMVENYLGNKKQLIDCDIRYFSYDQFSLATCILVLSFLTVDERLELLNLLKRKCKIGGAILILDKFFAPSVETFNIFQKTTWHLKLSQNQSDIVNKNLSLSGVQKQLYEKELKSFNKIFQYGEFSAFLYVKGV
jgi:tRNA (cmo5U34)-methyltransferase